MKLYIIFIIVFTLLCCSSFFDQKSKYIIINDFKDTNIFITELYAFKTNYVEIGNLHLQPIEIKVPEIEISNYISEPIGPGDFISIELDPGYYIITERLTNFRGSRFYQYFEAGHTFKRIYHEGY